MALPKDPFEGSAPGGSQVPGVDIGASGGSIGGRVAQKPPSARERMSKRVRRNEIQRPKKKKESKPGVRSLLKQAAER